MKEKSGSNRRIAVWGLGLNSGGKVRELVEERQRHKTSLKACFLIGSIRLMFNERGIRCTAAPLLTHLMTSPQFPV
jgi:hypothetical protein